MAYGICRIQKLKAGSVGGSAQHTNRQRYTPNADPEKQHIRIIGQPDGLNTPDLETIVRQQIGTLLREWVQDQPHVHVDETP